MAALTETRGAAKTIECMRAIAWQPWRWRRGIADVGQWARRVVDAGMLLLPNRSDQLAETCTIYQLHRFSVRTFLSFLSPLITKVARSARSAIGTP